jgi:hypothetical protein
MLTDKIQRKVLIIVDKFKKRLRSSEEYFGNRADTKS